MSRATSANEMSDAHATVFGPAREVVMVDTAEPAEPYRSDWSRCEHAVGERNQYLDRQIVKCEPGQLLDQFRLSNTDCGNKDMQYQFRCIVNQQTGGAAT